MLRRALLQAKVKSPARVIAAQRQLEAVARQEAQQLLQRDIRLALVRLTGVAVREPGKRLRARRLLSCYQRENLEESAERETL